MHIHHDEHTAEEWLPDKRTITAVRRAAEDCRACPLWERGTQTVFGEGLLRARLMVVGEQPGDREDLQGRPFVGPAGRILDEGLAAAGIERGDVYVTNVVKHFKWVARGRRRLHQKPNAKEIGACMPWLDAEIDLIRPDVLLLMGATASKALLGRDFKVTVARGRPLPSDAARAVMATIHPSAILRARSDRQQMMTGFIDDLKAAHALLDAA